MELANELRKWTDAGMVDGSAKNGLRSLLSKKFMLHIGLTRVAAFIFGNVRSAVVVAFVVYLPHSLLLLI